MASPTIHTHSEIIADFGGDRERAKLYLKALRAGLDALDKTANLASVINSPSASAIRTLQNLHDKSLIKNSTATVAVIEVSILDNDPVIELAVELSGARQVQCLIWLTAVQQPPRMYWLYSFFLPWRGKERVRAAAREAARVRRHDFVTSLKSSQ